MTQEAHLIKLTNRHLAKLLDQLDEIQTPEIVKNSVKAQVWYLVQDIKEQVLSKEQANGNQKE
jgi:hypothetical protein